MPQLSLVRAPKKKQSNMIVLSSNKLRPTRKKTIKPKRKIKRKKVKNNSMVSITPAGKGFLRSIMAPADFSADGTGFVGIPDEYSGPVVTKRHELVQGFPSYTTGRDLYIVQLPTPGYAYWYGDRTAGGTGAITLTGVPYGDSTTLFPSAAEDTNVVAFRYASNVLEYVCTNNDFTYGGAIHQWKTKITTSDSMDETALNSYYASVELFEGLNTLNSLKPSYVSSIKNGIYSPNFNVDDTFEFTNVKSKVTWAEMTANLSTNGGENNFVTFTTGGVGFVGLGTFETTIIKFPAIIAAQTGFIRSWSCVEYQVNPLSILYDYRHISPPHDPTALALLKSYRIRLPSAVDVAHNGTFWDTFVNWVQRAAGIASYIPGPVGAIANGVKDLISFGHSLW